MMFLLGVVFVLALGLAMTMVSGMLCRGGGVSVGVVLVYSHQSPVVKYRGRKGTGVGIVCTNKMFQP